MELHQIRAFVALAEERTMTAAAERLGVTQPAVSAALKILEQELKTKLFLRSRLGLQLTDAGSTLLARAREMLAAEAAMLGGRERRDDEGTIRVAGRQGFMQYVFPLLIHELKKELPLVTIEFALSSDQNEVVDALRTGRADIGFAPVPGVKSLQSEVFFHDPVWLAVGAGHPLGKRHSVSLRAISELPLCLPAKTDRLRGSIDRFIRKLPSKPGIVLETNDYTLMRNLVRQGECAGFVYGHMLVAEGKQRSVVPLNAEGLDLRRDLTVVIQRDSAAHVIRAKNVLVQSAQRVLGKISLRG